MKHLSIIVLLLMLVGCKEEKKEVKTASVIEKYVFLDSDSILHTTKDCFFGLRVEDENENYTLKPVQFIDTFTLNSTHMKRLCPDCVEDYQYEKMLEIVNRRRHDNVMPGVKL